MFCPQCGAKSPDGSTFCPMCGANLQGAAPAPEPPAPTPPTPPTPPQRPAPPTPPPTAYVPQAPAAPAAAAPAASGALYPKGPLGARLGAVIVDSIIAAALLPFGILLVYASMAKGEAPVLGGIIAFIGALWQLGYLLARDAARGAGFGKRLFGLVVVSSLTGAPARAGASIVRQLVFLALNLIPGIGSIIEPIATLVDKDGRRIGDKAAKTQVVRSADVAARGIPVAQGKGAAIGVLIAALLVGMIGATVGGIAFAQALNEGGWDSSTIEIGDGVEDDAWMEIPEETVPEEPGLTEEAPSQPTEAVLGPESATDAVGNLLVSLMNDDVETAKTFVSTGFMSEYDWFLYPSGGALIEFEVVEVFTDGPLYGVRTSETWNSGPESPLYFVIEEDGQAKVDSIIHEEY